jgi:hypothetical protein
MTNMIDPSAGQSRRDKTKGFLLASLIVGAVALPFLMPAQIAQADNEHSERGRMSDALLGTWVVQVSIDPNSVPPGTPVNFTTLLTYGAGGGYVESNNGPNSGGPGSHGNWVGTDHHRFAATQARLEFDTAHKFTGSNRVRSSLMLNQQGDELSGTFQVDLFLPDGTPLPFHPVGTYHDGYRMPVQPLN